jgi:hypothetical protein
MPKYVEEIIEHEILEAEERRENAEFKGWQ